MMFKCYVFGDRQSKRYVLMTTISIIIVETLFDVRLNWSARWEELKGLCLDVGHRKDMFRGR